MWSETPRGEWWLSRRCGAVKDNAINDAVGVKLVKSTRQQFLFLLACSRSGSDSQTWQPLVSPFVSQEESPHSGHDGGQFPPDWVHLWPPRHEHHFEWLPRTAAPGHQAPPDSQEPLASQPRLQSLFRLRLSGGSLRPLGDLPRSPAEDL